VVLFVVEVIRLRNIAKAGQSTREMAVGLRHSHRRAFRHRSINDWLCGACGCGWAALAVLEISAESIIR
jgi:hypothetical protein